jgi:curved DNA-binding protein CbpA
VTADRERARRQYRQRARLFHPDVCADARAHEAFALVQRAWDVFESYVEGQTKQA